MALFTKSSDTSSAICVKILLCLMYSFMKLAYAPVRISGDLSKIYDSFLIPAFAPPFSTLLYMP